MTLSTRFAVVGVACLSFVLTGCGFDQHPAYSDKVKYGVRVDPLVVKAGVDLAEDRYDPERPGVFPLMKLDDAVKPDHPYYPKRDKINEKILLDPTKLSTAQRAELEGILEKMFGTPAHPKVDAAEIAEDKNGVPALEKTLADLQLKSDMLEMGSKHYRVHCLHCHGVPGDGRGPTARWISPHPRDFRQGLFKFQSIDKTNLPETPPSRADIMRTLRQGIEGTAMPTFNFLSDKDLDSLVSYVIHLSMRGKTEFFTLKDSTKIENGVLVIYDSENPKAKMADIVKFWANDKVIPGWAKAQDPANAIKIARYPHDPKDMDALAKSIRRGELIFTGKPSDDMINGLAAKLAKAALDGAVSSAQTAKNDTAAQKKKDAALEKKRQDAKKANAKLTDEELKAIQLDTKEEEAANLTKDDLAALKLTDKEKEKALAEVKGPAEEKARIDAKGKLGQNCYTCHINYGRQALYRVDEWGTLTRPNNFTQGVFRGGKRPVDIYYRIHSGINGYPMVGFGTTFKGHEEYMWDLVNFVSYLSYPSMRKQAGINID